MIPPLETSRLDLVYECDSCGAHMTGAASICESCERKWIETINRASKRQLADALRHHGEALRAGWMARK